MSNSSDSHTDCWTYFEAGEDTLADVPPVGDAEELQQLLETLRDSAEGEARPAYDDAASLVEAHRIRKLHRSLSVRPWRSGQRLRIVSLFAAAAAGVIMPIPELSRMETLGDVSAALLATILSLSYVGAVIIFSSALLIQTYGVFKLVEEAEQ
jgi:ABC-type anion transport system duplicated permease subunit